MKESKVYGTGSGAKCGSAARSTTAYASARCNTMPRSAARAGVFIVHDAAALSRSAGNHGIPWSREQRNGFRRMRVSNS
jgi:hypothetical protein